jgi:hypothetical protein
MLPKILFWIMVALDVAALGFVTILGLGFAGPSHTYRMNVVGLMLVPTGVLAAAVALFVFAASPVLRGVAFLLAASPVIIVAVSFMNAKSTMNRHTDADGAMYEFVEGPERALEKAIKSGDFEAVKLALPKAKINAKGVSHTTALTMALDKLRDTGKGFEILRAVLEAGANPNVGGGTSILPLEQAIAMTRTRGIEPVMLLLKAGAKPNQKSKLGEPAFFMAAGKGIDVTVMKTLAEHGADVRLLNEQGYSAVYTAINTQNWPVALYLLEKGAKIPDVALERLESDLRTVGDSGGLAAVLAFVKKAGSGQR